MIINELVTKFSFNVGSSFKKLDRNLGQTVKNTNTATTKMGSAFKRMGDSVKSALKFKINVLGSSQAKAIIGNLHNQIKNMKRSASSPLGGMIGGAIGIGAATGAAMSVFETAKSYESLKASLVSATGSAEGANRQFKQLQDFAKTTPYSLEESVKGFVRLKNLGLDTSERSMRSFGNTAGAMSKSMMDMIEAVADASTGEFERLKEFGIKASKEGDNVTFTFQGVKKTVKNDAKSIQKYLVDLGETKFGGGMALQSKTIGGAMSNLQDSLDQAKFAMWQSGMGEAVTNIVKGFTQVVEQSKPLMVQFGLLAKNNLPGIFKALGEAMPLVSFGLGVMAVRFGALKSMQLAAWAITLATEIKAVGVAAWFTNGAIGFIPGLIIGAIAAIALFAADTVNYMNTGKSVLLDFTAQWPWLHKSIKWVMNMAITFFGALYDGIKIGVEFWMPKLQAAWPILQEAVRVAFAFMETKFGWLISTLKTVANLAGTAFNAVSDALGGNIGNEAPTVPGANGPKGANINATLRNYNASFGKELAQFSKAQALAMGGLTSLGRCAFGVETSLAKLGVNMTGHAYQLKDQLDRDKRFKRVEVTDEMMKRLPAGAITVFNKNEKNRHLGKGALYGHVEVSLGNGQAASDFMGPQMVNHYAGGERYVYLPVTPGAQQQGKGVTVNMTVNGNPDPRLVRQGAQDGVLDALNRNQPRRVPAGGAPTK